MHAVPDGANPSAGQALLTPSQFSATSQVPLAARHEVPEAFTPSAGQLPAPSQFSASSQAWPTLAARHSTEGGSVSGFEHTGSLGSPHPVPSAVNTSAGQAELTPSHCSSSSQSPASGRHTVP